MHPHNGCEAMARMCRCRDELNQPVFIAMDAFEFPELHDESIPCFNFLTQLTKLMAACGVKDFGWRVGDSGWRVVGGHTHAHPHPKLSSGRRAEWRALGGAHTHTRSLAALIRGQASTRGRKA
jgi:hypothetical protein